MTPTAAAALAAHCFLEGSAIAVAGPVAAVALAVHAFAEGLATGALPGGQPRRLRENHSRPRHSKAIARDQPTAGRCENRRDRMAVDHPAQLDTAELERQVKALYGQVAQHPEADFHFPVGRALAERLGYPTDLLDRVPADALASFAGVGYHLDLAELTPGIRVLDLGSGSGTDSFAAAHLVAATGQVTGIDMTDEQLAKAERLRSEAQHIRFVPGRLEDLPFPDASFDVVISNGVINLCPDKPTVFREAARVLVPGGRLAVADIIATRALPGSVTGNADLWSACIGGAAPEVDYRVAIDDAGLVVRTMREVPQYQFLTGQARNASGEYGVRAVTLRADCR